MSSSLDVYFCFVIILITYLWELSGAKERISLLIEGKHFYKLNPYIFYLLSYPVAQLVKNQPAIQETLVRFLCQKDPWRMDRLPTPIFLHFPGGSDGKESACNVGDLGWEDSLEEGMATHSSTLPWRIPMDRGAWRATVHGVTKHWTRLSNQITCNKQLNYM